MVYGILKKTGFWALLAVALALMPAAAVQRYRAAKEIRLIHQLVAGRDIEAGPMLHADAELRLARAYYLKQKRRYDEALEQLNSLVDDPDPERQTRVRYNLGNLYLEQAMAKLADGDVNAALPLAGLAKQAYRQTLRLDSGHWDAKYNLEVAMQLLPEPEARSMPEEDEKASGKKLWTTIPGFPRGLP